MKQYTTKFLKFVAGFFIFFPALYIVLAATLFDIPLDKCGSILLSPFYYITTFCAATAGYGLWEMRRWAWYYFVTSQILVAYSNANWVLNYSESHHKIIALIISIFLQVLIFLRVSSEVRVPYLFPSIRWWESNPRYRLSVPVVVTLKSGQSFEGEILDLSILGCFIKLRENVMKDDFIQLKFRIFGHDLMCEGVAVWLAQSSVTHPKGLGVKFVYLPKGQKRILRNIQKRLKKISAFYRRSRYWMSQEEFFQQLQIIENESGIRSKKSPERA